MTEERIKIEDTDIWIDDKHDVIITAFYRDYEQLKSQILNDHEIVNRLKIVFKLKNIPNMCNCGCHSDLELLKWIKGEHANLDQDIQKEFQKIMEDKK